MGLVTASQRTLSPRRAAGHRRLGPERHRGQAQAAQAQRQHAPAPNRGSNPTPRRPWLFLTWALTVTRTSPGWRAHPTTPHLQSGCQPFRGGSREVEPGADLCA